MIISALMPLLTLFKDFTPGMGPVTFTQFITFGHFYQPSLFGNIFF